MKSSSSLASFFGWAVVWFCVTTIAWMQVSAWTSYPAAGIAHIVLGADTNNWVRSIHKEPDLLQVNTRIRISMPEKDQESGTAELVADSPAALGVAWWQMEGIALGYQSGSLLLPALAPVALWLWLDREFFAAVIIDGWLRKAAAE